MNADSPFSEKPQNKKFIDFQRFESWFPKVVLTVIALVMIVFVVRSYLDACLDTALSKFIPDSLTTTLVLITLAVAGAPYFAGLEFGPLKIPKVGEELERVLKIVGPVLAIFVVVVLFVPLKFILRQDCFRLRNASAEEDQAPVGWTAARWPEGRDGNMEVASDQKHSGARSFKISASEPNHLRFVQPLRLERHTKYLLSAWVRTENVAHSKPNEASDRGANIAIQCTSPQEFPTHSDGLFGTNDWRKISLSFETGNCTDIEVQLQLGGYSATTTGTAWFDDVELKRLS